MRTVEVFEQCCEAARLLGYQIRHEWLGGSGGGACEFGGRKWIFIDLALNAEEQLEQVAQAIRQDPRLIELNLKPALSRQLGLPKVA